MRAVCADKQKEHDQKYEVDHGLPSCLYHEQHVHCRHHHKQNHVDVKEWVEWHLEGLERQKTHQTKLAHYLGSTSAQLLILQLAAKGRHHEDDHAKDDLV